MAWSLLASAGLHLLVILAIEGVPSGSSMPAPKGFTFRVDLGAGAKSETGQAAARLEPEHAALTAHAEASDSTLLRVPEVPPAPVYYALSDLDNPPQPIGYVEPEYPAEALAKNRAAILKVELLIGEDGRVDSVKVLEDQGDGMFEQAVTSAFERQTFTPAMKAGKPARSRIVVVVEFGESP